MRLNKVFIFLALVFGFVVTAEISINHQRKISNEQNIEQPAMDLTDADKQKLWDEYYSKIRRRRLAEAKILWSNMLIDGINENTELQMDFKHFCPIENDAINLAKQLSENYEMKTSFDKEQNMWFVYGTTRPYSTTVSQENFIKWIEFMADVANSYACVFTNWTIEAPKLDKIFKSEIIETGI